MMAFLWNLVRFPLMLLGKLAAWRWRKTRTAWRAAWREPARPLRLLYLSLGLLIAGALIPVAFGRLGVIGGSAYVIATLMAIFDAAFFRTVRIGRFKRAPSALMAPFLILAGVTASFAIRPLLGDAKNAALAQDFVAAVIILGCFALMSLWFRRLQSGRLY